MPKLTIDGREIEVEPGTTVIHAADSLGIYVPHYCWHPGLTVAGNCRMCLVEVEKMPKLAIACSTMAADGMVVRTVGEKVKEARDAILELLLINHPLDCPICDQAGECRLQEYAFRYGPAHSRFLEEKVHKPKRVDIGTHVVFDAERCILCTRCVRFCQEVSQTHELTVSYRGDHATIETYPGMRLDNPYSGSTVDICPVGALTLKEFRFKQRVWFLKDIHSVCAGCARGCSVINGVSKGRIQRITPRTNPEVNGWWICDEGRLSHEALYRPGRITAARVSGKHAVRPMVEGDFAAVRPAGAATSREGSEALSARREIAGAAGASGEVIGASDGTSRESGGEAGAPGSAAGPSGANGLADAGPGQRGSAPDFSSNRMSDLPILETHERTLPSIPMLNEGVAPLPRRGGLLKPGETVIDLALDAAARALEEARAAGAAGTVEFVFSARALNEDLYVLGKLARDGFGVRRVALPAHERGEDDALLIRKDKTPNRRGALAILQGLGLVAEPVSETLARVRSGSVRVLVALGPHLMGKQADLAAVTGGPGPEGPPSAPGAADGPGPAELLSAPGEAPGSTGPLSAPGAAQGRLGGGSPGAGGTMPQPDAPSRGSKDRMFEDRMEEETGRALGGAQPFTSAGDPSLFADIAEAARAAGATLIAIDAFESPLTERAAIVLPALTYGEIEGTVTNFEGRVQRVRAGLAPAADGLPVYRIVQELGRRLGIAPGRPGAQETFSALAAEVPAFGGLSYAKIGDGGERMSGPSGQGDAQPRVSDPGPGPSATSDGKGGGA